MTADARNPWVVIKFGGTSVATRAAWETIAAIAQARIDEGLRLFIVCSAVAGASDMIERLLDAAALGSHREIMQEIAERHRSHAADLGVSFDDAAIVVDELERLATGVALIGEATPRTRAQAMACGELLSTKLGAAFLSGTGLDVAWRDARDMLLALDEPDHREQRRYLHAACAVDRDADLVRCLSQEGERVIVTQGFIARNTDGHTVLLGRGGSDVSAAYFAAKMGAKRCEIWTDVPGMFTANPRQVPTARLITALDYDEAQEIATTGAKVLHPRALAPLKVHDIVLSVHCLSHPEMPGTIVSRATAEGAAQVKAISAKRGITIISMESLDMWRQAGFLADVFACFKRHGLSVDLVSTSETNLTVTLDRATNVHDESAMKALARDLQTLCHVCIIESAALVSLVGRGIRSIFHELGPALEVFEEQRIYLVTQAANDLNLSFVVDEDQADRVVEKLHGQIFGQRTGGAFLGKSWKELFERDGVPLEARRRRWWEDRRGELIELAGKQTPLYVYDEETIDASIRALKRIESIDRVFYSIKANAHPAILLRVEAAGLGFECVSAGEVRRVFELFPGIDPGRVLFTPNFVPREEYAYALSKGVHVTLDNLFPLERWPLLFKGRDIFVRMDPGRGQGHHQYVHTAGTKSKFGVPLAQLDELVRVVHACGARVVGLHAHVGSNIFTPDTWGEAALYLTRVRERFPDARVLDMGGGLGVAEKPGQGDLDLHAVDEYLRRVKTAHPDVELWIEPGRFVVAEAGVLLARVTQTKTKGDYRYVGIDAGMNTLIRPALYGSYQEIVNLSKFDCEPHTVAHIVGPICESGDIVGHARTIAEPDEGDVMLIATVGAYGRVMSSSYNLREPAEEHILRSR